MKIKMLSTKMGANDGVDVQAYLEGQEYEVSEDLANCFLSDKSAEVVVEKAEKAMNEAPLNKAKKAK